MKKLYTMIIAVIFSALSLQVLAGELIVTPDTPDPTGSIVLTYKPSVKEQWMESENVYLYTCLELDKNGDVSFEISFSWYDGTTVEEGKVYPDLYYIDDIEVTKEEYKERTNEYLSLGNEKVVWYNGSIQ